ncbi:MAG: DUF4392 domain-containing protein, partial [Propionivibrio sp.]|nr:DUF4392 domain-containing protein [Propionivibrio sp.]
AESHLYSAATNLLGAERVILVTGFCIRAAMIGETDGPSGTLAVAHALRQLGKEVVLVTDKFSDTLLEAGAKALGAPYPITVLSPVQEESDHAIDALLASFAPTQVVAIERPGSAIDGHRYSMRGEILDELVPSADRLLSPAGERSYATIAVGDGGNELGMGHLRDSLMDRINLGELIFCDTEADHVIPAGISNWGAYALAASLAVLSGKQVLITPEDELAILEAQVAVGAVDGCTRKNEVSVDGVPIGDYLQTVADIFAGCQAHLAAA